MDPATCFGHMCKPAAGSITKEEAIHSLYEKKYNQTRPQRVTAFRAVTRYVYTVYIFTETTAVDMCYWFGHFKIT